eukprot:m.417275 g.417275  ORF g.417275 m.417275 type:complete len:650 (+) comp30350_c0_seq1:72-2021(+)
MVGVMGSAVATAAALAAVILAGTASGQHFHIRVSSLSNHVTSGCDVDDTTVIATTRRCFGLTGVNPAQGSPASMSANACRVACCTNPGCHIWQHNPNPILDWGTMRSCFQGDSTTLNCDAGNSGFTGESVTTTAVNPDRSTVVSPRVCTPVNMNHYSSDEGVEAYTVVVAHVRMTCSGTDSTLLTFSATDIACTGDNISNSNAAELFGGANWPHAFSVPYFFSGTRVECIDTRDVLPGSVDVVSYRPQSIVGHGGCEVQSGHLRLPVGICVPNVTVYDGTIYRSVVYECQSPSSLQVVLWSYSDCTGTNQKAIISDGCSNGEDESFTGLLGNVSLEPNSCSTNTTTSTGAPGQADDACPPPLVEYVPQNATTARVCGTVPNVKWHRLDQSGVGGRQSITTTVSYGATSSRGQSQSKSSSASWAQSASSQVSKGFSTTVGASVSLFGVSASVHHTWSGSRTTSHTVHSGFTSAVSGMFTTSFGYTTTTEETHTFQGADVQALWQLSWNFTAVSPPELAGTTLYSTRNYAATQNDDMPPCCLYGLFVSPSTPGSSACLPIELDGVVQGASPIMCPSTVASNTASPMRSKKSASAGVAAAIAMALLVVIGLIVGAYYTRARRRSDQGATTVNPVFEDRPSTGLHQGLLDGGD